MSAVFAVLTSDPNLLACQLERLDGTVGLAHPGGNVRGLGFSSSGELLLERLPSGARGDEVPKIGSLLPSGTTADALIFHEGELPFGRSLDENTQPFRARGFLFAHAGPHISASRMKGLYASELPQHLLSQVRGESGAEIACAMFVSRLKVGSALHARNAAEVLREVAGKLATAAGSASLVATNGQVLVAARVGERPLHYALLEGLGRCEVCNLGDGASERNPAVVEHRRVRTVAVTSEVLPGASGFIELPEGKALAVDSVGRVEVL